jgi:hypothetical protein
MAREEQNREDLLRDATVLVERAEFTAPGFDEPIVAGFRRDGSISFYFGADPVYQFNAADELRRAYVDGLLYKAVHGQLASLRRQRSDDGVELIRRDLDAQETAAFLARLTHRLGALHTALAARDVHVRGQVPPDSDVIGRLHAWLDRIGKHLRVARSPRVV